MDPQKRAVVLVEEKYENLELWYPYWRLVEYGLAVDLVGPECGKTYGSKEGYPCTTDVPIGEALERRYEAIVVPGGWAPDRLRRYPDILRLVKKVHDEGGIVASICHGPWVLVSARILAGRKVTCVGAIKDDVVNAGAEYLDREVVVDRNIVTSRTPKDTAAYSRAIIGLLDARGSAAKAERSESSESSESSGSPRAARPAAAPRGARVSDRAPARRRSGARRS
jgi:protease I